jgi:hypothetical protein
VLNPVTLIENLDILVTEQIKIELKLHQRSTNLDTVISKTLGIRGKLSELNSTLSCTEVTVYFKGKMKV